jgi:hypothetical protein
MPETLFKSIAPNVAALRVHLGLAKILLRRDEVSKPGQEGAVNVDLVGENDKYRRYCRNPLEGTKAILQADGCDTERESNVCMRSAD